jgi:hypothetical protein
MRAAAQYYHHLPVSSDYGAREVGLHAAAIIYDQLSVVFEYHLQTAAMEHIV